MHSLKKVPPDRSEAAARVDQYCGCLDQLVMLIAGNLGCETGKRIVTRHNHAAPGFNRSLLGLTRTRVWRFRNSIEGIFR